MIEALIGEYALLQRLESANLKIESLSITLPDGNTVVFSDLSSDSTQLQQREVPGPAGE